MILMNSVPYKMHGNGIETRVIGLKGWCPIPNGWIFLTKITGYYFGYKKLWRSLPLFQVYRDHKLQQFGLWMLKVGMKHITCWLDVVFFPENVAHFSGNLENRASTDQQEGPPTPNQSCGVCPVPSEKKKLPLSGVINFILSSLYLPTFVPVTIGKLSIIYVPFLSK